MKRYRYTVTVTYQGTFELDDDEAADYDADALQDAAIDDAFATNRYDVDDVDVQEVEARV